MATVDHKITKSQSGSDDAENLVGACYHCNNARGDISYNVFMRLIKEFGRTGGAKRAIDLRRRRDRARERQN